MFYALYFILFFYSLKQMFKLCSNRMAFKYVCCLQWITAQSSCGKLQWPWLCQESAQQQPDHAEKEYGEQIEKRSL